MTLLATRDQFADALHGSRLRVCHLGKYYPPGQGGMETHLQTLARAQADLGVKVHVVCVNHARASGTLEEWDGAVRLTRVARWGALSGLDVCPGLLPVLRDLRRDPPELIHLHTPNPTMLLPLAALPVRVPLVITHHSDIVRQKLLRYLHHPFERRVYDQAALILATSKPYAEASEVLQRYTDKVRSLPLGLDLDPFLRPSRQALDFAASLREQHGSPLWLCVSRLIYYKGIEVALEALRSVPGKLLVIGTGPLHGALQEQAQHLSVAERVVWQGQASQDELVGAYLAATALWFPSNARSEAFGQVQVEAMASGCPVINTAIPGSGVPWVCPHEETGLMVPVGDAPALALAARRLVNEAGLRERLAANGRERAVALFGHVPMAQESLRLYGAALERSLAAVKG